GPLLSDDRGRAIGGDESSIRAFEATWNMKRPSKSDADSIREQVEILLRPLDEELAKNEPSSAPSETVLASIRGQASEAENLTSELRLQRQQVERLLAVAETSGKRSQGNLEQAMAQLHQRELEEKNQRLADLEREGRAKISAAEEAAKKQEAEDLVKIT